MIISLQILRSSRCWTHLNSSFQDNRISFEEFKAYVRRASWGDWDVWRMKLQLGPRDVAALAEKPDQKTPLLTHTIEAKKKENISIGDTSKTNKSAHPLKKQLANCKKTTHWKNEHVRMIQPQTFIYINKQAIHLRWSKPKHYVENQPETQR